MRTGRLVSFGWGATTLLLVLSVLAALRLASIGAETLDAVADDAPAVVDATDDIVAVIEPATADYLAEVLDPAFAEAHDPDRYPFRVFSPGMPAFLAESSAMVEVLEIAREAGVEAMVVRPDRVESLARAERIASEGVFTVTIGTLLPDAATHIRVGADPAQYGSLVASALAPYLTRGTRVGYLCGLCSGAEAGPAGQVLESVTQSPELGVLSRGGAEEVVVQRVDDVELGSVAAARSLLLRGVEAVFCDTTEATIAMAQVVIDANLVGQVRIIGFGDSERVLSLVDDRVVHATVSADYGTAARDALRLVMDALSGAGEHSVISLDRPVLITPELSLVRPEADS